MVASRSSGSRPSLAACISAPNKLVLFASSNSGRIWMTVMAVRMKRSGSMPLGSCLAISLRMLPVSWLLNSLTVSCIDMVQSCDVLCGVVLCGNQLLGADAHIPIALAAANVGADHLRRHQLAWVVGNR